MKVYVVWGATGEYSDSSEWIIAIYPIQEEADNHCDSASKWAEENGFAGHDRYSLDYKAPWGDRKEYHNPYDPKGGCDYTGVWYFVTEAELFESLEKFVGE